MYVLHMHVNDEGHDDWWYVSLRPLLMHGVYNLAAHAWSI